MKRNIALLVLFLAVISCSSATEEPPPMRGMRMRGPRPASSLAELLPPEQWWRSPRIAEAVDVSSEQLAALDQLSSGRGDDVAKLERDGMVALRNLRTVLDSEKPSAEDITAAANLMKAMGDALFDRQVQYLAAQRALLSREQWTALQNAIEDAMPDERMEREAPRRMGPGGRGGGRGRFPG